MVDCRERVARAGRRIAGRLDHDIQTRRGDQGAAVVGETGAPVVARGIEIGRIHLLVGPAGIPHEAPRPRRLQVRHSEHVQPGVWRAWARNIVPNLPAPIRPTRIGAPAAARCASIRWRFMTYPGTGSFPAASPPQAPPALFRTVTLTLARSASLRKSVAAHGEAVATMPSSCGFGRSRDRASPSSESGRRPAHTRSCSCCTS